MTGSFQRAVLGVVLACGFALYAVSIVLGDLNQDEGWYLYAARLVAEGLHAYRDFAFTQGPMVPYVYGLFHGCIADAGVLGGRILTGAFGLLGALAAVALARRLAPPPARPFASLAALSLILLNVYQAYFTTVVKTYALCALLLACGFLCLAIARDRRSLILFAASGLLLAAAAATRLSSGIALAVAGAWLLLDRRALGRGAWLAFSAGGLAGLALLYGPFIVAATESFRFFVLEYHGARDAGSTGSMLVLKAGFVSRVLRAYAVAVVVGVALLAWRRSTAAKADGLVASAWVTVMLISLLHLSAPFPYDDYQAPLFPLAAALVAVGLARRIAGAAPEVARRVALALVAAGLVTSAGSPMIQDWMVLGRDRIWWVLRERPALLQLRDIGREVRARSGDATELLTQDTYLAVESGLRVPRGFEMGPFSFYPDLETERARRLHVVNRELFAEAVAGTDARLAALSEYSFVIAAPSVRRLPPEDQASLWLEVEQRFELLREIPRFGQGGTRLRLFARRAASP